MIRLQPGPIDVGEVVGAARGDGDGAVSVFLGTVRSENAGRTVLFLEYEAYAGMAEREMERIAGEARERYPITRVAIVHRTGRLEIGDASIAIAVAAPHRSAAMEACRFVIDNIKTRAPIWKREHFDGGEIWIE